MNQIEKKAAEWDGVVDAVQDSSSRRERLEKRLIYLNDYLQKYDDVSEQIYNNFSKEIAEIEEELGKLGG
jgi:archaellum component FlaC